MQLYTKPLEEAFKAFDVDPDKGLNEAQREAVTATEG